MEEATLETSLSLSMLLNQPPSNARHKTLPRTALQSGTGTVAIKSKGLQCKYLEELGDLRR